MVTKTAEAHSRSVYYIQGSNKHAPSNQQTVTTTTYYPTSTTSAGGTQWTTREVEGRRIRTRGPYVVCCSIL